MSLIISTKDPNINANFKIIEMLLLQLLNYKELEFTTEPNPANETVITHSLERIPTKYIQMWYEDGCVLEPGDTEWTATQISFKGTLGDSLVKVRIS